MPFDIPPEFATRFVVGLAFAAMWLLWLVSWLSAALWASRAAKRPPLREEAAYLHNKHTAAYLLGKPMLGDHLEEGLAQFGISAEQH